jgi:hypothetical protein
LSRRSDSRDGQWCLSQASGGIPAVVALHLVAPTPGADVTANSLLAGDLELHRVSRRACAFAGPLRPLSTRRGGFARAFALIWGCRLATSAASARRSPRSKSAPKDPRGRDDRGFFGRAGSQRDNSAPEARQRSGYHELMPPRANRLSSPCRER